jgi:hypothetical protein
VPVPRLRLGKSCPDAVGRETRDDDGILVNVILIVVGYELMAQGLAKNEPDKTR